MRNELTVGKAPAEELRLLLGTLPDYAEAAEDPRAKSFVAREIVALTDEPQILKDLGAKDVNAAVAENGKKVYEWFRSNEKYLYRPPGRVLPRCGRAIGRRRVGQVPREAPVEGRRGAERALKKPLRREVSESSR